MSVADRRTLILDGARRALEVRAQFSIDRDSGVDPIDLAGRLGLQVWLRDANAYDGVYSSGGPPIIVLASNRPLGRTAFTCAHEIGHHIFGHGATVEEIVEERDSSTLAPAEVQADSFAANLLMPRSAVVHAMAVRGIKAAAIAPAQVFQLASWLGVGYASLISHMCHQLKLVNYGEAKRLKKNEPRTTKALITGVSSGRHDAILVDAHWGTRSIDCRVDDYVCSHIPIVSSLLGPANMVDGRFVHKAKTVGIEDVALGTNTVTVRISRHAKTCRAIYMHDPEDEDE